MPRVISDELFEQLIRAEKEQRLLGVMGMLYELRREAICVEEIGESIELNEAGVARVYEEKIGETKTNNN